MLNTSQFSVRQCTYMKSDTASVQEVFAVHINRNTASVHEVFAVYINRNTASVHEVL